MKAKNQPKLMSVFQSAGKILRKGTRLEEAGMRMQSITASK